MKKMMAQMSRGGMLGNLGRKMAGGLAGGLGGLLGGGGDMGMPSSDDDSNGPVSRSIRKKKRHKKRR
jgi:hypothetical protein